MKTLDDAWNPRDWETFMKRHAENVALYWPGQPEPTRGRHADHSESVGFFHAVENHIENDPYMILFGQGDHTCSVARWTGTHTGPLKGLDGQIHPATHRKFSLEFCTVARWKNGEIVEEKLFYDLVGFMTQLNLLPKATVTATAQYPSEYRSKAPFLKNPLYYSREENAYRRKHRTPTMA